MRDFFKRPSLRRATKFSDVIPESSILDAPLEELAIVILNSLKEFNGGGALSKDSQAIIWSSSYRKELRRDIARRITEAWQLLQQRGLIAETKFMGVYGTWFVTEGGLRTMQSHELRYGVADLLPTGLLVHDLVEHARPLFLAGRYDDACSAAFRELEINVRSLCGFADDVVGVELMREAFKPDVGPLTDAAVPKAEQVAVRDLFAGAMGYFRNPLAHRKVGIIHATQCASIILFANELIVTARRHKLLHQQGTDANTDSL